jgi:hypothetical protein
MAGGGLGLDARQSYQWSPTREYKKRAKLGHMATLTATSNAL